MEKAINSNYNNFEETQNNLKAVVIGGSGAIGRVNELYIFLFYENNLFVFIGVSQRVDG